MKEAEPHKEHQLPKPPPITRSLSKKGGGPFERMPSLEEPSPTATACLKIDTKH